MPKVSINYKTRTGRIVWDRDDWVSGMNKEGATTTITGRSLIMDNANGGVNPFNIIGTIRPTTGPENLTNHATVTGAVNGSVADGFSVYGVCADGKIQKASEAGSSVVTTDWPVTITPHGGHSGPVGEDIVIYNQGGTDYAFYSWSDDTDGDVGRFDLNATFDDDYMSTVPDSAARLATTNYHPMVVGLTGCLFIGDGNNLHKLDNTTFTPNKLVLPTGFIITSFAFYDDYLIVYAHRRLPGSSTGCYAASAFFWDEVSPSFNFQISLDGSQVRCGFTWNGIPGCFITGNRNLYATGSNLTKLKLFDGRRFKTVETVKDHIMPVKNGVVIAEEYVLFMTSDSVSSKIYCYGSPNPDIAPTIFKAATLIGTTTGSLLGIDSGANTRLWSSTNGDTGGNRWQNHRGVHPIADTYLLAAVPPLDKKDRMSIQRVMLKMAGSLAAGAGKLKVELLKDFFTNIIVFNNIDSYSNNAKLLAVNTTGGQHLGVVEQTIGAHLYWSNATATNNFPIVREVIVEFNIIN